MVIIYTTPSCAGCRKAKKWFEEHKVDYLEKNLMTQGICEKDIDLMLENTEAGFDDIISTRSKAFLENNLDPDNMTVKQMKKFIIENPSVLRRPIIIEDKKMQVGFNDEEIRTFIPRRLRQIIMDTECTGDEKCDYLRCLKQYFNEMEKNNEL